MDTLEDLDFADDIVLPAHRHQDIQRKTNDVALIGRQVGLNINTDKTKLMYQSIPKPPIPPGQSPGI